MRLIFTFFLTLSVGLSFAQQVEKFEKKTMAGLNPADRSSLMIDLNDGLLSKRIKQGHFVVTFNLGENVVFDPSVNLAANLELTFRTFNEGVEVNTDLTGSIRVLSLKDGKPSDYIAIDLKSYVTEVAGDDQLDFDQIEVEILSIILPESPYNSQLQLELSANIIYSIDVRNVLPTVNSVIPNNQILVSNKNVDFIWSDDMMPISNYEIQVLKLSNYDEDKQDDQQDISTKIDWNRASSYIGKVYYDETNNVYKKTLALAEGTGYYTFRVRAISDYFLEGDFRNFGTWSEHDPDGTIVELNPSNVELPYFFFTDPDEDKNWIYSRVFTELGKTKESISFANGLSQASQTQTYLPSQDVTIITQTVYDLTGRPSLVTIPIPLNGRSSSYRKNFIMNSNGDLYKAEDFDLESTFLAPSSVTSETNYYNNPNPNIPYDEGYGYTRTIYYNDPLNRQSIQSGVGSAHSINNKNTQYLYSTPAEDELVALFGDEAPDHESVVKTITVDPNNVASVTYTSKEGHVIATNLAFYQDTDSQLELEEDALNITANDKITKNTKTAEGFKSSKRISILETTPLQLSYSIECEEFEALCQTTELDCNYSLDISIIEIGQQGQIINRQQIVSENLSSIECQEIGEKSYKLIAVNDPIELLPGTYIVEKTLKVGDVESKVSDNSRIIRDQVEPITEQIATWLESIETTEMLISFNQSIYEMSLAISNGTLDEFTNSPRNSFFPVTIPQEFFDQVYDTYKDQYQLYFQPESYNPFVADAGNPIAFTLGTPCCTINVPVSWVPPFDCEEKAHVDNSGDGYFDVVNYLDVFEAEDPAEQDFLPDFEGYMLAFMSDCIDTDFPNEQAMKDVIYDTYMSGWEIEGTFNMMIYHMLTDEYNTLNTSEGAGVKEVQYDCDQLLGCWEAQLTRLKDEICVKFNFYQDGGRKKVSDAYDGEYADDPDEEKYEKDHNGHFDDNFKGGFFLTRWIAKRKVSKRMRRLQTDEGTTGAVEPEYGQFHIVKEFLECTGYKFAKVLTPFDGAPLQSSTNVLRDDVFNGFEYVISRNPVGGPFTKKGPPMTLNHMSRSEYFGGAATKLSVMAHDYAYAPLADWNPIKRVQNSNGEFVLDTKGTSLFPFIKNPVYAFKYFEYDLYDDEVGNPLLQNLESQVCFNDPNDCFQLDVNGLIVVDGSGNPIKVPCCSANPAWDEPSCYADTEYPGLNPSMVGYGTDATGNPAKYVMSDFCEQGRIRCPYTYEAWSAGQRLAFYNRIKNYVRPEDDEWKDDLAPFDLTCTDLNTPNEWFVYTGDNEEQEVNSYPDLTNRTLLDNNGYPIASYTQLALDDGTLNFRYVALEVENLVNKCNSGCESKRGEFRRELISMLVSKCYDIGGCFVSVSETPEVIPEADIDLMVDAMINMCQSQCTLTTFSCETSPCRSIFRPNVQVGFDQNEFKLQYGMGGYDPKFCDATSYSYVDATKCFDTDEDGISECELTDPVNGNMNLLSWYEYTKLNQVDSWQFDIEMPMMCRDADGNTLPDEEALSCCTPGTPNTAVGDTFVPKSSYEINANLPEDGLNPSVGEQVKSPAMGINVKVVPDSN